MKSNLGRLTIALIVALSIFGTQFPILAQTRIDYPDLTQARGSGSKSGSSSKLSSDLRILSDQYSGAKGSKGGDSGFGFTADELKQMYGISADDDSPVVGLAVTVSSAADVAALKRSGMKIYIRKGNIVYGQAPVSQLGSLASERAVVKIASTKSAKIPEIPKSGSVPNIVSDFEAAGAKGARGATAQPLANEFAKGTLTGKGVIVGVIDTGIDFRHPDFIRPDGTSRILAIWDLYDESFDASGGKIGTAPPRLTEGGDPLFGTVYTNAQINAALKGTGTVNTVDNVGHGTAVAGTAAGNGRASTPANAGVAPEADLIIVKACDCDRFTSNWVYGAEWIDQFAKSLKRPVVVNGSFGGHWSAHDGKDPEETFLNGLTGKGIPGVLYTMSAGNEGYSNMHAAGRFGPKRPGQQDIQSSPISVTISAERTMSAGAMLLGFFDARDDWAAAVVPSSMSNLKDKAGNPLVLYLVKSEGEIKYITRQGVEVPDDFDQITNAINSYSSLGATTDMLALPLPAGTYDIYGFATSAKVLSGNFDFYAPNDRVVDFGRGTTKTGMVGSPGNAANVITVGAYNFRKNWTNLSGTETVFGFDIGEISDYSSPGGRRRDGVVKPDIAAPATYTISPLSADADSDACGGGSMGAAGASYVMHDGKYIAWQGTSASAPFAAGVVALMLQKNPTLDAEQVRQILIKTAKKGGVIGGVPNPSWGYGMLDPAAALKATPAAVRKRPGK
jgi:minor extracellular serine protease Vpr